MSNDELLEPKKAYKKKYKQNIIDEAGKYFDKLKDAANLDVEKNRETVAKIKNLEKQLSAVKEKNKSSKTFFVFMILLGIIFIFTGIILFCCGCYNSINIVLGILLGILFFALGIFFICFFSNKRKKEKSILDSKNASLTALLNEQYSIAYGQMKDLNNSFDFNMHIDVINDVIPIVELDKIFDAQKALDLERKYKMRPYNNNDISILGVQSGQILGNPFMIVKFREHFTYTHVYTGSIVVTVHRSYTDSKGHIHHTTESEVLEATYSYPAEGYKEETRLIYGNHAAPDLEFSRDPQGYSNATEKVIDRFVKREMKTFKKEIEKSTKKGGNLTSLGNDEFECLFHAWNRTNETQFRLLYTPLAQVNTLDLLKTVDDGFGDDFKFIKDNEINIIISKHSNSFNYTFNPLDFISFSYDLSKARFVNYVSNYFRYFYFDLAPLISIPLYQQYKTKEYIYDEKPESNYSVYEQESIINNLKEGLLVKNGTDTLAILKASSTKKDKESDKVLVDAYSYHKRQEIMYVRRHASDGAGYDVPVIYYVYEPLKKSSVVEIKNLNISRFDFNSRMNDNNTKELINKYSAFNDGYTYHKKMFAFILNENSVALSLNDEIKSKLS